MASITQYTGSRYVPVFADPAEWNSTRTYEPLTIVLNEGNSYTSRQFVPVGVELTNTDYWLETGNYNAQIEKYRQTVIDYVNQIEMTVKKIDTVSAFATQTNLNVGDVVITKGFYTVGDRGSALYLITSKQTENGMTIINANTYSALLIESTPNALQLGFKQNDTTFDNTEKLNLYATLTRHALYFPAGKYYFLSGSNNIRVNIYGAETSQTDRDSNIKTAFYYTGSDTVFLNVIEQSLIKNIAFIGKSYTLTEDRSLIGKNVNVFTENVDAYITAINIVSPAYGSTIENCFIYNFYTAINGATFCTFNNNNIFQCHYGIYNVFSDCTLTNNRFFTVYIGIRIVGANNIITNTRGDSIAYYFIENRGSSNIISNVNADYCQYNVVYNYNVNNCIIENIEARCGTIYPFNSETDGNINSWQPTEQYSNIAQVVFDGYANKHNYINVHPRQANPLDTSSNWICSLFGVCIIHTASDLEIHSTNPVYVPPEPHGYSFANSICFMPNASSSFTIYTDRAIGYTPHPVSTVNDIYVLIGQLNQ